MLHAFFMVGLLWMLTGCSDSAEGRGAGASTADADPAVAEKDAGSQAGGSTSGSPGGAASADDADGDGFRGSEGDCNDTSVQINPGAFDAVDNGYDEDCDGVEATAANSSCETGLAIDSNDALDAARAIGLCKRSTASSRAWGVIAARYVRADAKAGLVSELLTGLLPSFGATLPLAGEAMAALSSGVARAPDQPDYSDGCDPFIDDDSLASAGDFPPGLPRESPACRGVESGELYDSAALELELRVPTNVRSLAFDTNFFTYEYPDYICSRYNDFFVALLSPAPADLADGNIVFDADGNLISVNNGLLQVCEPGRHGNRQFDCPLGRASLSGSGFDGSAACGTTDLGKGGDDDGGGKEGTVGAATGWLHTTAPVAPGSIIKLRFAIWDSGDPVLDSTVLIDNFQWSADAPQVETVPVVL